MTRDGSDIMKLGSQLYTKFCDFCDGEEFIYDTNTRKNVLLDTMMTRHTPGQCRLRVGAPTVVSTINVFATHRAP